MSLFAILAVLPLSAAQGAPPPAQRVYQPTLLDPGVHAGALNNRNGAGDLTVDGRILVSYRRSSILQTTCDGDVVTHPNSSLFATVLEPDNIESSVDGYLTGFQGPDTGPPQYTFPRGFESTLIEESPRPDDYPVTGPPPAGFMPRISGTSTLSLALRPTDDAGPPFGENPFPCDANGDYDLDGGHLRYELWLVLVQHPWTVVNGEWVNEAWSELGARDLTLILDEGTDSISSCSITAFQPFVTQSGAPVHATEPSVTLDGRLVVYNGSGAINGDTSSMTTYAWNGTPCSATGWSEPASIAAMHANEADSKIGAVDFADFFPVAKYPIRDPDGSLHDPPNSLGEPFLRAPYPWISKDGMFFLGTHAAVQGDIVNDNNDPSTFEPWNPDEKRTRVGMIACGSITGGYLKHIDDTGLNPTRSGSRYDWPPGIDKFDYNGTDYPGGQSARQIVSSTGLTPGPWSFLPGQGVPVPSQLASVAIPVLPVFSFRNNAYGEVRFEEADGEYLLYLACNESFQADKTLFDLTSTPDTSGQAVRCDATLHGGAGFPQEAFGGPQAVRLGVGGGTEERHENLGYKGQAIAFPEAGRIEVTGMGTYTDELTLQAFVKVLPGWNAGGQSLTLLESPGRFRVWADAAGGLHAQVTVFGVGRTVSSNQAWLQTQVDPFDTGAGWRHVAVTFNGQSGSASRLRLNVDGVLQATKTWNVNSAFSGASGTVYVGPNDATGSSDPTQPIELLDEVAVSRVVRTPEELRRDAYVAPLASAFEPLSDPPPFPLPEGLLPEDVLWLAGDAYEQDIVDLGEDLFHSTDLSADGTRSCATCHVPAFGFTDGKTHGGLGTPTLLNMGFGGHKFFDGRSPTLENQAVKAILTELDPSFPAVLARLNADPLWPGRFDTAFGSPGIDKPRVRKALAMFQRRVVSGGSAFDADQALRDGDPGTELLPDQARGRAIFFGKGRCFTCHTGSNLSNDEFRNIHSVDATAGNAPTQGRGGFTGRASELGRIKVPTLRDVARTAPYFHDDSASTLLDVVEHYEAAGLPGGLGLGERDRHLLPLLLTTTEKLNLVEFLKTLDGSGPNF